MKILAIGDFHGKFPEKLKKEAKNVDLIVSVGDYSSFSLRIEFFKYIYRKKEKELWEFIGKKKVKEKTLHDIKQGKKILKILNSLNIPIISITGNSDYTRWKDAYDSTKKLKWKWPEQDFFSDIIKKYKNIRCFDYSFIKLNNLVFIGMPRSTFPGKVKSKNYKRQRKKLEKLFSKFKEKIIFVSHNAPYGKLDAIKTEDVDKKLIRKHYGSKLARRLIDKYKPFLVICGHMHENPGKDKIGKTLIINSGAAFKGKAAIIDLDEKKGKIKSVKFLK